MLNAKEFLEAFGAAYGSGSQTNRPARSGSSRESSGMDPLCVIIDGRSGAGKTTLAQQIVDVLGNSQLVQLEYLYDGWDGMDAAAQIVAEDILAAGSPGYHRYNWNTGSYSTSWIPIDLSKNLIIEGCGAVTETVVGCAGRRYDVITIDVDAPASIRRQRALKRSPEMAPFWDMWAVQEDAHRARQAESGIEFDYRVWNA